MLGLTQPESSPKMLKKLLAGVATLALALGMVTVTAGTASATGTAETATCVASAAYDETVVDVAAHDVYHAAVPETFTTVHHEATFERWTYIKQEGDPASTSSPVSAPTKWNPDEKKTPAVGDPIGTPFQEGNGNGSWFFWTGAAAYDTQVSNHDGVAAYTEHIAAVTHVVHHDAVICPPVQPEPIVTHSPVSTSDCEAKTVTTVDTISTTTYVLNESETAYIKGTPVITTETSTREMNDAEVAECPVVVVPPVQPEPIVSTRAVSTDTISCATNKVSTVTEHYTTTTTYVYNAETNSYDAVKGDEVRGDDTSSSRNATLEECPVVIPGKPGAVVTNTASTTIDCGAAIATTRSSTTTVDYKLVDNVWVKQAPVTVQDPDTTRAATDAECGLPTFALVTPVVTSVDRTCTVNGSYTLGVVDGVIYTVNGTVQEPGTYQVSSAKTVNVVASLTSSDFGFEQGAAAVHNLTFTDPKNCGELATLALPGSNGTLAFTGSNGTLAGGLLLGLMFVLFGAGVITVNRVNRRNS
jgi:hypothetical protein